MTVLYVAGSGRSGSTLLTTVLGQIDGFFAAGELRYLWQRGLRENRPCGCGLPVRDCPVWTAVLAGVPAVDPGTLRRRLRMRRLPRLLRTGAVPPHPDDAALTALYASLHRHTGGAVVVDSSKLPPYGALVGGLGVDLKVLHLVRDPRAAAFSWRRRRALDGGTAGEGGSGPSSQMTRHPVWKAALLWTVWNAVTVRLWARRPGAYLRVRYEDLIADPQATVRAVMDFAGVREPAGVSGSGLPFTTGARVRLAPTHSVAGNPSRHRTGEVPLTADDEWRRAMPRRHRAVVAVLTAPLRRSLGYGDRR
ncbi:sulfotransferase family protein [Mangrovihabitans endophyticus]|uniref:Sulfotransferase n=1 Tax=Mangrovihabitans endophyticus TaxID=1751298 RepID=A0A8J3C482_9ACTN|nr:sulfotransferase [Mangrovihabitans endophyticus]GGL07859.1 sulfotransferase [Mangrovihabitans endophyticus]